MVSREFPFNVYHESGETTRLTGCRPPSRGMCTRKKICAARFARISSGGRPGTAFETLSHYFQHPRLDNKHSQPCHGTSHLGLHTLLNISSNYEHVIPLEYDVTRLSTDTWTKQYPMSTEEIIGRNSSSMIEMGNKKIGVKVDFLERCLVWSKNAALLVAFNGTPLVPFRFNKIEPHLSRLRELQLRDLYHGGLKSFLDNTMCEFPTLTTFMAEENRRGLGPSNHAIVFNSARFPKLQFLAIKGVEVDATSSESVLPKLMRLRLQELEISGRSLAFLISRCTSLEHLDLQDTSFLPSATNSLEYVSDTGGLYRLKKLKTLSVSAPDFHGLYRQLYIFRHRVQIPFGTYRTCIINGAGGKCRHSIIVDNDQLRKERKNMKALLHTLVLSKFPRGSKTVDDHTAQVCIRLTICVKLEYDLRPAWREPNPRWGYSDLDELGRILQGIPAARLNIHYVNRTTCQDERGWRAFLANFPDWQRLSVRAPAPVAFTSGTTGVKRVLDALQRGSSEEHAGVSEGAFVRTKLQRLAIRNFNMVDRDRFDADLSRMLESRRAAGVALQQVKIDRCMFNVPPSLEE
ncbi:hypothetical protein C8Q74DRAFT_1222630 [Fomes fomentarius]|nr:hypothetical protein C8Q74DRAFT_1222630 [Fomes fomentarius]